MYASTTSEIPPLFCHHSKIMSYHMRLAIFAYARLFKGMRYSEINKKPIACFENTFAMSLTVLKTHSHVTHSIYKASFVSHGII